MDKIYEQLQVIEKEMINIRDMNDGDKETNHFAADMLLLHTIQTMIDSTNDPAHKALLTSIIENYRVVDKWYA